MTNNIKIANETLSIIKSGCYYLNDKQIQLCGNDYCAVEVYTPIKLENMLKNIDKLINTHTHESCGRIKVVDSDSFEAANNYQKRVLVMNFANAQVAGGGFRLGATAQEEALCRNSTLYASISSRQANEMYKYNISHPSAIPSAYMLLSPDVCVFRDKNCHLLENPFSVSVITIPAPNRHGLAAFIGLSKIERVMKERIRMMFAIAMENNYEILVLGAWGCGAFGHKAQNVARYFRDVLIDERYAKCFEEVIFAIYHGDRDGKCDTFRSFLQR